MNLACKHPPQSDTPNPADEVPAPPDCLHHQIESGLHIVTFDRPHSSANIFDHHLLTELDHLVDLLQQEPPETRVLFLSAKPKIFLAGADLKTLQQGDDAAAISHFIELGQNVFEKIASLRCLTISAIHGACLGGGLEFALACRYRIASKDKSTKIGLPETKLGILPAWGGTTRLPRLIGTPRALKFILSGKAIDAVRALRLGIIDEVIHRENFIEHARRLSPPRQRHLSILKHNRLLTAAASIIATRRVNQKTQGRYPSPVAIANIIRQTAHGSVDRGLKLERETVLKLAQGQVCHNLIQLFLLGEAAKKLYAKSSSTPVSRTAIIGAGVMGAGITYWLSSRRLPVVWNDIATAPLARGMASIRREYERAVQSHIFTRLEATGGLDRVYPVTEKPPLQHVDLVIEAAVEKMDLKREIFKDLDRRSSPDTLLATNTSALSITELAAGLSHPERVVGLHFFNPVTRMPLVEVIAGDKTSEQAVARATRFVIRSGKTPVVSADRPGFIVNRILVPYMLEAAHMVASGSSPQDIDASMLKFGMPMGPVRLADEVGLDIALDVAGTLAAAFPDRVRIPAILEQFVQDNQLGRKSGHGFYHHTGSRKNSTAPGTASEQIEERLLYLIINESTRCLEENVASAACWIDLAMVMGTGFAPWTGGPLRYADHTGASHWLQLGKQLQEEHGPRYNPAPLLQQHADTKTPFYEN